MRAALFSPVAEDDRAIPYLAETAIFAQWFHSSGSKLHYARWKDGGEVDMVMLSPRTQKAIWAIEIKWSDRYCEHPGELESLIDYCVENELGEALVTSKTRIVSCTIKGVLLKFTPVSLYCYTVGYNIIHNKTVPMKPQDVVSLPEILVENDKHEAAAEHS